MACGFAPSRVDAHRTSIATIRPCISRSTTRFGSMLSLSSIGFSERRRERMSVSASKVQRSVREGQAMRKACEKLKGAAQPRAAPYNTMDLTNDIRPNSYQNAWVWSPRILETRFPRSQCIVCPKRSSCRYNAFAFESIAFFESYISKDLSKPEQIVALASKTTPEAAIRISKLEILGMVSGVTRRKG